ncbi:50S ribosomal protein L24e [Thermoplasmatales archaeon AK]|nr:50S ribosomal protein L24e [Thermoplasmatales archaeon AK]
MATKTCSFCGSRIEPGTGTLFVRKDGTLFYFCSRKCQTNMFKLGRAPRRTKWTNEYHTIKGMRKQAPKA